MTKEFDWQDAVNEWQQHEPQLPVLKKNMRWRALRMKLILALDVAALLFLAGFTFYIFQQESPLSTKVWFCLVLALTSVGVYFDFYLRKGLWSQPETTKQLFEHMIKHAKAGVDLAVFAVVYLSVFLLFIVGWAGYIIVYETGETTGEGAVFSLSMAALFVIVSIAASVWYRQKKRVDLKVAKDSYQAFLDEDES